MNAPGSYDAVLYPSGVYPQTHPSRLAATAILLGMNPPPVSNCRVLELGCGDGLNLIALAFELPRSQFVGIDLAALPLERGRELAREVGIGNLDLRQLDVAQASDVLGRFDYIIAHGLYSWVPAEVRERLLALCGTLLAEEGVAYVSYNAYPGNHTRDLVRRMMRYHVHAVTDPAERVNQARALLSFLVECNPVSASDAYRQVLKAELDRVAKYRDAAFYHDDLSSINQAFYFHEFVAEAARHGLQYLAEAQTLELPDRSFPPGVQEKLAGLKRANLIAWEQYTDFVRGRSFRQTLLCRQEVSLDRDMKPGRLRELFVASPARAASPNPDLSTGTMVDFSGPNAVVLAADHPLTKAALLTLGRTWPRYFSFRELLDEVCAQLGHTSAPGAPEFESVAKALEEVLVRAHETSFAELRTLAPEFVTGVSERPAASKLARCQLRHGQTVATRQHTLIKVEDALGRHLIGLLDGARDRAALLRELGEAVRAGAIPVLRDGKPVDDVVEAQRVLADELDRSLAGLARCALLVA